MSFLRVVVLSIVLAVLASIGIGSIANADSGGTTGLGYDDPYTQLINHHILALPDEAPTYDIGIRSYVGSNGWEIRLDSRETKSAIQLAVLADSTIIGSALGGTFTPLGDVVMALAINSAKIRAATGAGLSIINIVLDGRQYEALLGDKCLGITIPPASIAQAFNRAAEIAFILVPGNLQRFLKEPRDNDIKVWLEKCAPGDGPKADTMTAPPAPAAHAVDTQPATAATTVSTSAPVKLADPAPVASPVAPVPAPAPVASPPAPTAHALSMDELCAHRFGDGSSSGYADPNSPYTWHCIDPAGMQHDDLHPQEDYCDWRFPGTEAKVVPDGQIQTYWWKCVG